MWIHISSILRSTVASLGQSVEPVAMTKKRSSIDLEFRLSIITKGQSTVFHCFSLLEPIGISSVPDTAL